VCDKTSSPGPCPANTCLDIHSSALCKALVDELSIDVKQLDGKRVALNLLFPFNYAWHCNSPFRLNIFFSFDLLFLT
jgi:hypothetical protein